MPIAFLRIPKLLLSLHYAITTHFGPKIALKYEDYPLYLILVLSDLTFYCLWD